MTEGRESSACDLHPEGSGFCTTCRFGLQVGREAATAGHPFTCVVCGKPGTCDDGSECPGVAPVDDAHCHHNECMEVFGGR